MSKIGTASEQNRKNCSRETWEAFQARSAQVMLINSMCVIVFLGKYFL